MGKDDVKSSQHSTPKDHTTQTVANAAVSASSQILIDGGPSSDADMQYIMITLQAQSQMEAASKTTLAIESDKASARIESVSPVSMGYATENVPGIGSEKDAETEIDLEKVSVEATAATLAPASGVDAVPPEAPAAIVLASSSVKEVSIQLQLARSFTRLSLKDNTMKSGPT